MYLAYCCRRLLTIRYTLLRLCLNHRRMSHKDSVSGNPLGWVSGGFMAHEDLSSFFPCFHVLGHNGADSFYSTAVDTANLLDMIRG